MTDKNTTIGSFSFRFLSKNTIIITAKILISAGLLYYLISSVEYNQIILALNEANLFVIGVVLLLGVVNIFLQYSKWRLTCAEVLEVKDKFKVFRSLFYGFSAGIITPLTYRRIFWKRN